MEQRDREREREERGKRIERQARGLTVNLDRAGLYAEHIVLPVLDRFDLDLYD
jgi:hypothetical protein